MTGRLYYIIAIIYLNLIIKPFSFFMNFYYRNKLGNNRIHKSVLWFINERQDVKTINDAFDLQRKIIKEYRYDFFGGALNWLTDWDIIIARDQYLNEDHSFDCNEYATILAKIIQSSNLMNNYEKLKRVIFLSEKPFVRGNHTMLLGFRKDNMVDVFSPYKYIETIFNDEENLANLHKIAEKWSHNKIVYNRHYILTNPI